MNVDDILSKVIKNGPELLRLFQSDGIDMPNINFPTLGGEIFWNDIYRVDGWRVQQNTITKHCRVLDPDNIRRAWGSEKKMKENMQKMYEANKC